jgi:hypothetical protein
MSNLTVKLFVGCLINPEIRRLLKQSSEWKEASIEWQSDPKGIREIRYQDHDYVGKYIEKESAPLPEIKEIEREIKNIIEAYCPDLPQKKLKIVVFPHLFIS